MEFTFGHHETGGSKKKIDEEDTNLGIDGRFDIRHRDPRALSSGRLSIQVFVLERTNQYLLENPRCGMFV